MQPSSSPPGMDASSSGYVRLTTTASPFPSRAGSLNHDHEAHEHMDSVSEEGVGAGAWWLALWQGLCESLWRPRQAPPSYQSNYMTLIPLSDSRLKPRRTKLIVASLLLMALASVVAVFLFVPRGVSVGTIDVHSTKMTFNATTLTYRIILMANIPVNNPNYTPVRISGNLSVWFFDAEAGSSEISTARVARRSSGHLLGVKVDASNLPRTYTKVVYTHCFNFPRKLIFFLLGRFKAEYLGTTYHLPKVDTYFMLDCDAKGSSSTAVRLAPGAAAAALAGAADGADEALGDLERDAAALGWARALPGAALETVPWAGRDGWEAGPTSWWQALWQRVRGV